MRLSAAVTCWFTLIAMIQLCGCYDAAIGKISGSEVSKLFHRAFALYRANAFAASDKAFDKLLAGYRDEMVAEDLLSAALVNSGNIKKALDNMVGAKERWADVLDMEELKNLKVGDVRCMAQYSMGTALFGEGKVREGMLLFKTGLSEQCSKEMHGRLSGDLQRMSVNSLRMAETTNQHDFEFLWRAAFLAYSANENMRAHMLFMKANEVSPEHDNWQVRKEWSEILLEMGDLQNAEYQLATCLDINPSHSPAWQAIGTVQERIGKDVEASLAFNLASNLITLHTAKTRNAVVIPKPSKYQARESKTVPVSTERAQRANTKSSTKSSAKSSAKNKKRVKAVKGRCENDNLIPGLSAHAFHNVSEWPIVKKLEKNWRKLRVEVLKALRNGELRKASMPDTEGLASDPAKWTELNLYFQGRTFEQNLAVLPGLANLLHACPEAASQVFGATKLSVVGPGKVIIKPHCGPSNTRLRLHLPLVLPDDAEGWLRVGDEKKHWKLGKCLGFDDSFRHEVYYNHPTEMRAVLIMDVWHPDMTEKMRKDAIKNDKELEVYNYRKKMEMSRTNKWFNSTAFN